VPYIEYVGYAGAGLMILTLAMKTMIPLRMVGIASNICSMLYGLAAGIHPMLIQHSILLPLNIYRLYEMHKLIRQVRAASEGDHSMGWLKPFMTNHPIKRGDVLFHKGDEADHMYFVVSGELHLRQMDRDILPGAIVGELGFLSPDGKRTQTVECSKDGVLLEISYERLEELYFQNPSFGFYFLRLTTARLFENIERLEKAVLIRDDELADLRVKVARTEQARHSAG
jgi:hypothetical protein